MLIFFLKHNCNLPSWLINDDYLVSLQTRKMLDLLGRDINTDLYVALLSQTFCNIFVRAHLRRVYHMTKAVQAIEDACCVW